MIYRTAPFSMTLNDLYPQFQGYAILWRWIYHKRYDIHSFNEIPIGTYTRPAQQCHFEWPWVTVPNGHMYVESALIIRWRPTSKFSGVLAEFANSNQRRDVNVGTTSDDDGKTSVVSMFIIRCLTVKSRPVGSPYVCAEVSTSGAFAPRRRPCWRRVREGVALSWYRGPGVLP